MIDLRPWQRDAIRKALAWFSANGGGGRFLINAAPGSGKTVCAAQIASELINKGEVGRVIIIAPRIGVVNQWAETFRQVTGRHMTKVTVADHSEDSPLRELNPDLCATWSAIQGLSEEFDQICASSDTLVICDEHHHAAIDAIWGEGAMQAFSKVKFSVILTGTPIRSDGREPVWFAYDSAGRKINHPDEGTYSLTYGKAVDYGYCVPATFHTHEGRFSLIHEEEEIATVSSRGTDRSEDKLDLEALNMALEFYKLACTPQYEEDERTPSLESYQADMLAWGIDKLDDLRLRMPGAGGLVIAPTIEVAGYMTDLLKRMGEKNPVLVHSQQKNPDKRIDAFRNSDKRWLVSVAMVSEGIDIPRLRILVYLPKARTELAFRQALGRVVRARDDKPLGEDDTRAYFVMPKHKIFEEYARRVEEELKLYGGVRQKQGTRPAAGKVCPVCEGECDKKDKKCGHCGYDFPEPQPKALLPCPGCQHENPKNSETCSNCGERLGRDVYRVQLKEAFRQGAIVRGMDISEESVQRAEAIAGDLRNRAFQSGDENLIRLMRLFPEESLDKIGAFFAEMSRKGAGDKDED